MSPLDKKYSIAQTRDNLAAIIHSLEKIKRVEITRRGEPVAVLISKKEFDRMSTPSKGFWERYQEFLSEVDLEEADLDPDEIFKDVRDKSPGRIPDL